ncbi:DAAF3 factor, partial [Caloenas nicobarica]|nr:DAAF3 factor [Caloenas nicobarica]
PVPAMEEALGTVCWWGLSPAIDLRLHREHDPPATPGPPPVTPPVTGNRPPAVPLGTEEAAALLVGAAEGRHVLLTAARARRGPPRDVTLFVAERRPESVSRQLLFLLLATEAPGRASPAGNGTRGPPPHRPTGTPSRYRHRHRPPAPPAARAATILELLGSVRVRPGTAAALSGAAARLRRWVAGTGNREPDGPAELELMKVR